MRSPVTLERVLATDLSRYVGDYEFSAVTISKETLKN